VSERLSETHIPPYLCQKEKEEEEEEKKKKKKKKKENSIC